MERYICLTCMEFFKGSGSYCAKCLQEKESDGSDNEHRTASTLTKTRVILRKAYEIEQGGVFLEKRLKSDVRASQ